MNKIFPLRLIKNTDGSMMMVVLMIMAILSIMGFYAVSISNTEQQITTNVHTQKQAFYNADAGVQFTIASLKKDLEDGNAVLPTDTGTPKNFTPYSAPPAKFSFAISPINLVDVSSPPIFEFTSTGSAQNAFAEIESQIIARFTQPLSDSLDYAAFGDELVDIKNSGNVESYDSESDDATHNDPDAEAFDSTHKAHIGSNGDVTTKNGSHIDGNADLGADADDNTAENNIHSKSDIYGNEGADVGRIDPDPLGIDTGGEYDPATYSSANDNATHMTKNGGAYNATEITTNSGDNITLEGKPGGSNFYFTDVELKSGVELEIDSTNGPVNVFMDGGQFDAKNSSITNTGGNATDFAIYSNYESTDDSPAVQFHHGSCLKGVVYAPKANILVNNSGDVYGLLWGKQVDIRNSGNLYYDEALRNKYKVKSNDLKLVSWEVL